MNKKIYNVGILGNSCTHGELVAAMINNESNARIIGGWEEKEKRRKGLQDTIGKPLASSGEILIDDKDIDIIVITCDPNKKSYWIEKVASAGKHIFLNKPMCEGLESAKRIVDSIDKHKVKLVFDIPSIRFNPLTAKLLGEVNKGIYGRPINYMCSWGMTFSMDFELDKIWPERLDSPSVSGGGELTNMGCYAIDYMVGLFGLPEKVSAKSFSFWNLYKNSRLENFGQIIADYGDFYAILSAGKQTLKDLSSMDVAEALKPKYLHNVIEIQFENNNITIMPFNNIIIKNGNSIKIEDYLKDYKPRSSFQQLVASIENDEYPESGVYTAFKGVEVLMAAYLSAKNNSSSIELPLKGIDNPLFN